MTADTEGRGAWRGAVGREEPFIALGSINLHSCYRNQYRASSKASSKTEPSHAILGDFPEGLQGNTPQGHLHTRAETRAQPCSSLLYSHELGNGTNLNIHQQMGG